MTDTGENRNVVCEWWTAEHFTLRGDTNVVTIKAHNDPDNNVGGILASFSNNVVTDESWQCADMSSWPAVTNASWEQAVTYGLNSDPIGGEKKWTNITEIALSAKWIWVDDSTATRVWCRKTFGKLKI